MPFWAVFLEEACEIIFRFNEALVRLTKWVNSYVMVAIIICIRFGGKIVLYIKADGQDYTFLEK